jgi:hypothetical protein
MLDYCNLEHYFNPEAPESFTGLYFPKLKVIMTAKYKQHAAEILELRDATSVREIKSLNDVDPSFKTLLSLAMKIGAE